MHRRDKDGYFKRVNPAFERTLGYTSDELLAKPFADFVHPDDRAVTRRRTRSWSGRRHIVRFENRYLRKRRQERWLQWSARSVPEEGLIYAAARDVTDSRRTSEEQAALRRVATLVAKGAAPAEVFDAVVAEMHMLLGADNTRLLRYEPGDTATVVAVPQRARAWRCRWESSIRSMARASPAAVWRSGRPARLDAFGGPTGLHRRDTQAPRHTLPRRGADHRARAACGG